MTFLAFPGFYGLSHSRWPTCLPVSKLEKTLNLVDNFNLDCTARYSLML